MRASISHIIPNYVLFFCCFVFVNSNINNSVQLGAVNCKYKALTYCRLIKFVLYLILPEKLLISLFFQRFLVFCLTNLQDPVNINVSSFLYNKFVCQHDLLGQTDLDKYCLIKLYQVILVLKQRFD